MAPVILALKKERQLETIVCVTGQHRDLLDQVLAVFAIKPDVDLSIMRPAQTLVEITATILERFTSTLEAVRPDRVLVHGDTTTSFACSLASFYAHTPVGHVEAGLRTGNLQAPWPEEYNRRSVDLIADLLWAPTQLAAETLLSEGARREDIRVTGNTVVDALHIVAATIEHDFTLRDKLSDLLPRTDPKKKIILVTSHRRENLNGGLSNICHALNALALRPDVELIWPVHPNPHVAAIVRRHMRNVPNVHLIEPPDYVAFVELMKRCHFIITDSGGVQEEAPSLSKPVLVTRNETERPEAILAGAARLVGIDTANIIRAAETLLDSTETYHAMATVENPFGDGRAALRVVDSILERHRRI
jgi:UDP-N-acetylglucosamine 2-epimerase